MHLSCQFGDSTPVEILMQLQPQRRMMSMRTQVTQPCTEIYSNVSVTTIRRPVYHRESCVSYITMMPWSTILYTLLVESDKCRKLATQAVKHTELAFVISLAMTHRRAAPRTAAMSSRTAATECGGAYRIIVACTPGSHAHQVTTRTLAESLGSQHTFPLVTNNKVVGYPHALPFLRVTLGPNTSWWKHALQETQGK